jgi:ATP-binding cassette subfamily F protein uup
VFDTIGDGNETVTVSGRQRHVNGYLRDFLFPPERARSPVRALSGGERNRLLLARLFTKPANVLVLDEPTNDLDLETLELLEAQLVEWPGTLLLVSHDRAFLDNVVTSTIVFEGAGRVAEYVGGYQDWLRQAPRRAPIDPPSLVATRRRDGPLQQTGGDDPFGASLVRRKLSYNEQRELGALPDKIRVLEQEHSSLETTVASTEFYARSRDAITATLARLAELEQSLLEAYARFDELKSRE